MSSTKTFNIRLRGIQGNDINAVQPNQRGQFDQALEERMVAMGMFEIIDDNGKSMPQSIAQIVFDSDALEKFGPKILKTGTFTLSFE